MPALGELAWGGRVDKTVDGHLITDFECLVDELTKSEPNETEIQFLMNKLELTYDKDPIDRIGFVLEKMNELVFETKQKKDNQ